MQHAAWVIAPLVVGGVLGLSATTKAGKGDTLRSVVANLRLPAWILPPWLARSIPAIEAVVALGLLAPWLPVFTVASAAAVLLLLTYWLLIARGLTLSSRPTCGCFGEVDQPISTRTLLRNTLLLALAAATLALALSGRDLWTVLSDNRAGDWLWLALAAVACATAALVLGAPRPRPTRVSAVHAGAASGAGPAEDEVGDYVRVPTPELVLHDPGSGPVTLPELSAKRAQLLIFVNCHCVSTTEAVAALAGWQDRLDLVDVRLVFSVPILDSVLPVPPPGTLVDHRGLAWRALDLSVSPSAVLLGADGHLAGGPVAGSTDVWSFVDDVADALSEAHADSSAHESSQSQLTGDR